MNQYKIALLVGFVLGGGELLYKHIFYSDYMHVSPELLPLYLLSVGLTFYGLYGIWIKPWVEPRSAEDIRESVLQR